MDNNNISNNKGFKKSLKIPIRVISNNNDNNNIHSFSKSIKKLRVKRQNTEKLPVTVLSGFLGSGKTTLLNYILNSDHGMKIAVIVNDMSEVNIDARLIKEDFKISRSIEKNVEKVIEMSNGCICCSIREDLLIEVTKLAKEGKFDYLIIESSGISEPLPIAETFTFDVEKDNENLNDITKLDTMATVIDSSSFLSHYLKGETLKDKEMADNDQDERTIVDLLVDQIEFSNVILLNKCDLLPEESKEETLNKIEGLVKHMNPKAKVIRTIRSIIPLDEILNTGLFNFKQASENPGWLVEVRGSHTPETIEYGITSFVFRARRPFHSERLSKVIEKGSKVFNGVLRSKGFSWICTTPDLIGMWNLAGIQLTIEKTGFWLADLKRSEYPNIQTLKLIKKSWEEPYGDRRNEIVFIGDSNMKKEIILEELNLALLNDDELKLGKNIWKTWDDPINLNEEIEVEI